MSRKYTPRIVLVKSGKKTRSAIAIEKIMARGVDFETAHAKIIKDWVLTGKIRG